MKQGRSRRLIASVLPALLVPCLIALGLICVARAQTSGSPSSSSTKSKSKKAASSRQKSRSSTASKTSSSSKKKTRGSQKGKRKAAIAQRQTHPTPERYAQIQEGLAKAGYFREPANGVWGKSSVTALAQFQRDNGLDPTGKIDSPSLIKLHLGPNYQKKPAPPSEAVPAAAPARE